MSTSSFRKNLYLSQIQLAEMIGVHKSTISVHESEHRPLKSEDLGKLIDFQLKMIDFDQKAPIESDAIIDMRTLSALEKQRRELLSTLVDMPIQLERLKYRLKTMEEYYTWAEGFLRTVQFLIKNNHLQYLESPAVKREIEIAKKYYGQFNEFERQGMKLKIKLVAEKFESTAEMLRAVEQRINTFKI